MFVGIGAQKAGTTWIAENLAKHPDIEFPAGKEVHFWNTHYARGVDWYKQMFTEGQSSPPLEGVAKAEVIYGDITPAYAFLGVEKIREFHSVFPDAPIIYCVRNPIDRAWSAARMMLKRSEMSMDEASNAWFIDIFKSQGSLLRGDYISAVDNWLSVFDEKQFLLLDFNDISNSPHQLLQKCCERIGADSRFFSKKNSNVMQEKIHTSIGSTDIRPSLLPVLHEIYDKQIELMARHPVLCDVCR